MQRPISSFLRNAFVLTRSFSSRPILPMNETVKLASLVVEPSSPTSSSPPEDLVILHGLFGSQLNFRSFTSKPAIRSSFRCHLLDLRNHGSSPHSNIMNYSHMAADVARYIEDLNRPVHLLGFSMGGKTAMTLALAQPDMLTKLVIGDIAPVKYTSEMWTIPETLHVLMSMDLTKIHKREDADTFLKPLIPDPNIRLFLLTNLISNESGQTAFRWRVNLRAVYDNLQQIADFPHFKDGTAFEKETLVVQGGKSELCKKDFHPRIYNLFPHAHIVCFEKAGHWVHNEEPDRFNRLVAAFLKGEEHE